MSGTQRGTTDQAKRIRRLKRRLYELKSLLAVTRDIAYAPDEDSVRKQFLRSSISMVHAESAAIFHYDGPTGRLQLVDERNIHDFKSRPTAVLSADEVAFLEGPEAREGLVLGSSRLMPESREFAREQGAWLAAWDVKVLIPLVARGGLWGVAVFGPRLLRREYGPTALGLLAAGAQTAATALETVGRAPAAFAAAKAAPASAAVAAPRDLGELRAGQPALQAIIGDSPALRIALAEIVRVAPTRFPVLILGPTGTGKELAAHAIHRMSPRAEGPFEVVDCGAIPRELIESELFGHVKGAFTGATRDRRGAFELAHGGTLFLDEVGELPSMAQTRLLRILQEGQLRRVGDERQIHVNVRVVAATNRELLKEVDAGRFRADLYYRLKVFTVSMPTLAERKGDMPLLVDHILGRLAEETGHAKPRLSQGVVRRLVEYPFPGNIRELQNILSVILLRHGVEGPKPEDLDELLGGAAPLPETPTVPDLDLPARGDSEGVGRWVLDQLRKCDFNVSQAERALDRLQRSTAGKSAAPVADRSSLTYYLQGECFRAFVESKLDLPLAARAIAKMPDLEAQARARMERFLGFVSEVASEADDEAGAQRACRERLPKLPALYLPYLDQIAAAHARGEWTAG